MKYAVCDAPVSGIISEITPQIFYIRANVVKNYKLVCSVLGRMLSQ